MKEKDNFVSVVVALYNQTEIFNRVLFVLANQKTNTPYEIIFADDGSSPENVLYYLREINKLSNNNALEIKFIQQQDKGFRLAASRNNALQLASGNIIICMDGDVLTDEYMIENYLSNINGDELTLLYSNRNYIDKEEIGNFPVSLNPKNIEKSNKEKEIKERRVPWRRVWGFSSCFSRPLSMKQDILYDANFEGWGYEDVEFSYRLYKKYGYKIYLAEDVVNYHVTGDEFYDNPHRSRSPKDLLSLYNKAFYFINKYNDDEVKSAVLTELPSYNIDEDVVGRLLINSNSNVNELFDALKNMKKALEDKYS